MSKTYVFFMIEKKMVLKEKVLYIKYLEKCFNTPAIMSQNIFAYFSVSVHSAYFSLFQQ